MLGVTVSAPGAGSLGSSLGTKRSVRVFNDDVVEFVADIDRRSRGGGGGCPRRESDIFRLPYSYHP